MTHKMLVCAKTTRVYMHCSTEIQSIVVYMPDLTLQERHTHARTQYTA